MGGAGAIGRVGASVYPYTLPLTALPRNGSDYYFNSYISNLDQVIGLVLFCCHSQNSSDAS